MVFSKDNLAVTVTCFTKKGWIGTQIANNFQTRSGISEASIEFLRSIITRALPIARKAAKDP